MISDATYWAEVHRDDEAPKGPGTLTLYRGEEEVGEWRCNTGDQQLDPQIRGGLTPPIRWRMVEPIQWRIHPQGHRMTMARIYPVDPMAISDFPRRGFALDRWPFMIHRAGRSTGCIAIVREDWESCVEALNRAWEEDGVGFVIEVS